MWCGAAAPSSLICSTFPQNAAKMRNTHDVCTVKAPRPAYIYIPQETIDAARRATKENGATSSGAEDASTGGGALLRKMVGASAAVGQEEGAGGKGLSSRMVLSDDEVLHQFMGCVRACTRCCLSGATCRWTRSMIGRKGSEATAVRSFLLAAFVGVVHFVFGRKKTMSRKKWF